MNPIRSIVFAVLLLSAGFVAANHHEADAIQNALDQSSRSAADTDRDAGRKPAEVLAFLGIGSGMTVMDVIAAGGWYTEVLSAAVGAQGKVYAQNPAAVLRFREGANDKAMTARLDGDRLPNVMRLDKEINETGLAPESLDAAITALNFHDVYNTDPDAAVGMLQVIHGLLKRGGILGIIDHAGNPGANNAETHRIDKASVEQAAREAGFEIAEESALLANSADDRNQFVFAPAVRGKTDRFLLKLIKPARPLAPEVSISNGG